MDSLQSSSNMKLRIENQDDTLYSKSAESQAETGSVNEAALHTFSASLDRNHSNSTPSINTAVEFDQQQITELEGPSKHEETSFRDPDSPPFPVKDTQGQSSPGNNSQGPSSPVSPTPRAHLPHSSSVPSLVSLQGFLRYIAERGRHYANRQRWRLVLKDGTCNISSTHVTERKLKYLVDLFTTVVDMKWRFNMLMFALAFVGSWVFFGFCYWLVALGNGDLSDLPPNDSDNHTYCVTYVYNFWSAFLFSMETQCTIGYGLRTIEPYCLSATFVLITQNCAGIFIQCLMTGIVFSKLSRPKSRAQTIMFSRNAVVCRREGRHNLLFRVGDMRKSHIIGTSIRAMVVRDRVTSEGECVPLCQSPLKVETEMGGPGDTFAFLVWPVTVTHVIDEESPFWDISADQLVSEHFEIIVILEGTIESNGKLTQVRTSYLPSEILWGHRLMPLLTYQTTKGTYDIDYKNFHLTVPLAMTEQSAKSEDERTREDGQAQQTRPFYLNTEKDSSISLVRSQGIGQPTDIPAPRRLYKRFRPLSYGSDAHEKRNDNAVGGAVQWKDDASA